MFPAFPVATGVHDRQFSRDAQRPVQLYVRAKFNRTFDTGTEEGVDARGAAPHRFFPSGELGARYRVRILQHQHRTARTDHREADRHVGVGRLTEAAFLSLLGLKQTSLPLPDEWALPDPHPQGYQFLTNARAIDSYAVPKDKLSAALAGEFQTAQLHGTPARPGRGPPAAGFRPLANWRPTSRRSSDGGLNSYAKMQEDSLNLPSRPITSGAGYEGLEVAQFETGCDRP